MKKGKVLAIILILLFGGAIGFLILNTEKKAAVDPHGHGHGEVHEDHGEAHGAENHTGHDHDEEGHEAHDHGEEAHGEHGESGHERHGERVKLDEEALQVSGITLGTAGPAMIRKVLPLSGVVSANQDRTAHVTPRFAGVVRQVRKHLGDAVRKGETLAVVESNESLAPYSLTAPLSGTVILKDVSIGETVPESKVLFTVSDLSSVWIDLNVYRQDFPLLKKGQEASIRLDRTMPPSKGRITYLSPYGSQDTQTMLARIVLPNPHGLWKPGLFVEAEVILENGEVALAVPEKALQNLEGKEVVFVKEGYTFEARAVELGRRDGESAEVLSGVASGDTVAVENSFVLKADLGKGEAGHEH